MNKIQPPRAVMTWLDTRNKRFMLAERDLGGEVASHRQWRTKTTWRYIHAISGTPSPWFLSGRGLRDQIAHMRATGPQKKKGS